MPDNANTVLTIDRLGLRGDGIASGPDGPVYAPLTLPGEIVQGQVQDGRMAAPRIDTPSPHRIRAACPHYRQCGGCALMHADDGFVAEWKRGIVRQALAAQGLEAPIMGMHTSPERSRRRAVLSGRRTKKGALLGFHARASDVLVDLADCRVLRPEIQAALPVLRQIVIAGGSRAGELTLTVIHGPAGLDVAVTGGKPMTPDLLNTLADLARQGDFARLDWDGQAITRRMPALPMGRAQVIPPPGAFLQATAEGEAALRACVRDFTRGATRIADLFAGIGTFSLPLAADADLHAVEGLAAPLDALDAARRAAPGLHQITHEVRDLFNRPLLPDELNRFDSLVLDPPRAGAELQVRQIAQSDVARVAYVSCDPVTFARDARILCDAGQQLLRLFVVDQFRWSPHVEIAAEFRKR